MMSSDRMHQMLSVLCNADAARLVSFYEWSRKQSNSTFLETCKWVAEYRRAEIEGKSIGG